MHLSAAVDLRIVAALAAATIAIAWWSLSSTPQPAPDPAQVSAPVPAPAVAVAPSAEVPAAPALRSSAVTRPPATVIPAAPPTAAAPVRTVTAAELEADFTKARDTEARAEAARGLASLDTPEAFASLTRLFTVTRAYTDRVALVGALSDSQSDAVLDAKFALLGRALARGESREVRKAAVDVIAQSDDPRAIALLRAAARNDTDPQIRELAKAVLPAE